jgi:putative nucleotidyltransferase with HDIG domain
MKTIEEIDPLILQKAQELIHERFMYTDLNHPAIQEIFNLCAVKKADDLAENNGGPDRKDDEYLHIDTDMYDVPEHMEADLSFLDSIVKDIKLPTLPDILLRINEVIRNPNSSAHEMAEVISMDAGLSSTILKIVNSAFYNFQSEVDTLYRAVAILGTKQLSTLTHGIKIVGSFKNLSSGVLNMQSFWKHSIACGIGARVLANYKGLMSAERLFMAGLLHDIGRLVLHSYASTITIYTLVKSRQTSTILRAVEKSAMKFNHAEIGGELLKKWNLPLSLENTVKYHHRPLDAEDVTEASIIHISDLLINSLGMGSSGEYYVPALDPGAWESLGLPEVVLPLAAKEIESQITEVFNYFFSGSGKATTKAA